MNAAPRPEPDTAGHSLFDTLSESYNYRTTPPHGRLFLDVLLDEVRRRPGARALDVGCGRGIARNPEQTAALRASCDELWGIEPDSSVEHNPASHTHFQHASLETASLPESYFHIVYSIMVMEHVEDPEAYFRAAARALKPGGVHIFCTPNSAHLFTIMARSLRALRLDEAALRLIRPGAHDAYHYPVFYRANSARGVRRLASSAGFSDPRFVYFEAGGVESYFPGPMRPLYWALAARRRLGRRRDILVTMIARMTRCDGDTASPCPPPT